MLLTSDFAFAGRGKLLADNGLIDWKNIFRSLRAAAELLTLAAAMLGASGLFLGLSWL